MHDLSTFDPFEAFEPFEFGDGLGTITPPSEVTLVSIAVTPTAVTINDGATQQFTATGTYSDSSTANITGTVTWDSSNDAVATVSTSGLATGVAPGQVTISATLGAASGDTTLDVEAVLLWTRDLTTLAVGADATFARASTAHHTQPDSLITQISTTEARFSGARRVANILRSSENLLTLEWAAPVNATVVGGVSDPLGGTTAYTLTATATNGGLRQTNTYIPSQTGLAAACGTSIWIRRRTGTGVISLYNPQTSVNITASVTGSWQRLFLFTTTVSTPQFFLSLATSGDAIDIWHPMISSHSVASPLPPEYVSTGVPTGPNVATNGTFDSDTGWTKGTGWTITGGVAVATATTGDLTLPLGTFTPVVGKTYFVSFDVVVTSGLVRPPFKTIAGDNISASGSYSYTHTATVTTAVAFDGVTSFTGTIDNVVIQECVGQANADGVQYFATANGNTVAGSYVVTEAQGAALPGPFGLLMEPAATNLCLQSQVAGTTWMQTNVTIAADSEAAPNGSLTADTLTAAAGDATWTQAVTAASADRTWSLWIKRKTGTGTISMSLDGGSTYTTKTITADWARYSITQTLANPSMMLKITTNADAVYVWGSQLEAGSIATSYIPTTTVAVTRAVDSLSYTGVPADNETRFVIDAANVDTDDWNGTMAPPTNPDVLSSIAVYAPEARP